MAKRKSKSSLKKLFLYFLLTLLFILGIALYKLFGPNTGSFSKGEYLYIPTGSDYASVKKELKNGGFVKDMVSFELLAEKVQYPARVRPGKYKIEKGMSNYDLVKKIKNGQQDVVHLVINKLRTRSDFFKLIQKQLETDTAQLKGLMEDSTFLETYHLTPATSMAAIKPYTYDFYWNSSAEK